MGDVCVWCVCVCKQGKRGDVYRTGGRSKRWGDDFITTRHSSSAAHYTATATARRARATTLKYQKSASPQNCTRTPAPVARQQRLFCAAQCFFLVTYIYFQLYIYIYRELLLREERIWCGEAKWGNGAEGLISCVTLQMCNLLTLSLFLLAFNKTLVYINSLLSNYINRNYLPVNHIIYVESRFNHF